MIDDITGTPKQDAPGNADKPVDNWITGDEPMTGAQASYLKTLCEEAGEEMDTSLSKAEASKRIDEMQREIEKQIVRLLALRQPMAQDLRVIVTALKIAADLERIGDYAANIAKRSIALAQVPPVRPVSAIPRMGRMVREMLKDVIDSYIQQDVGKAVAAWRRDEELDESGLESNHLLSDQIGCSSSRTERICTLERVVLDESVSTGRYTPNPDYRRSTSGIERYRYVLIDGQTYETSYVANQSVTRNGEYRIDLSLEPIPREDVLRAVSLDATRSTVSPVVRTAATAGTASTHEYIDVPETPVRLADGTYHRVLYAGWTRASGVERFLGWALTYLAPFIGVALLARVVSRVEVTYVGR